MQENFQSLAMYDISENFPPPEILPLPKTKNSAVLPRARIFHIRLHGLPFFAIRFRNPGDVQIPTAQTRAHFGAQSAPRLPNILRCAAECRPLTEEILSFPRFRGIKGRLSSRLSRAACANTKIFSARAEYILRADRRRRPEILSRNCIRAGPLSILCRLSTPRMT